MPNVLAAQAITARQCRDAIGAVAPWGTIAKSNNEWLRIVRYWQQRGLWSPTMLEIARQLNRAGIDDAEARRLFADECQRVRLSWGPLTDFSPTERRCRAVRRAIRTAMRIAQEAPE